MKAVFKNLPTTLTFTAGVVAGNKISNMIPIEDLRIKGAALLITGLLVGANTKGVVSNLSAGVAISGGLTLLNSFGINGIGSFHRVMIQGAGVGSPAIPANSYSDTNQEMTY